MKRTLAVAALFIALGLVFGATFMVNFAVAGFSLSSQQYNDMVFWILVTLSLGLLMGGIVLLVYAWWPSVSSTLSQPPTAGVQAAYQFFQPAACYPDPTYAPPPSIPVQWCPRQYYYRYSPYYPYYGYTRGY